MSSLISPQRACCCFVQLHPVLSVHHLLSSWTYFISWFSCLFYLYITVKAQWEQRLCVIHHWGSSIHHLGFSTHSESVPVAEAQVSAISPLASCNKQLIFTFILVILRAHPGCNHPSTTTNVYTQTTEYYCWTSNTMNKAQAPMAVCIGFKSEFCFSLSKSVNLSKPPFCPQGLIIVPASQKDKEEMMR